MAEAVGVGGARDADGLNHTGTAQLCVWQGGQVRQAMYATANWMPAAMSECETRLLVRIEIEGLRLVVRHRPPTCSMTCTWFMTVGLLRGLGLMHLQTQNHPITDNIRPTDCVTLIDQHEAHDPAQSSKTGELSECLDRHQCSPDVLHAC